MGVLQSVNWPLSTRLMCMAVHRKAVDVSAKYHASNPDVISVQCPDCQNVYWRWRKPSDAPRPAEARSGEATGAAKAPRTVPPWMVQQESKAITMDPC